jgi:hypothetical protein
MTRTIRHNLPAGTRYFPTMHALAATQAVLGPLLGQHQAQFPPDPLTVQILRILWHRRAQQLAGAGYRPLQHRGALQRAMACPHALLAPDPKAKSNHPCHLDRVCPFCQAHTAALTFENVWRAVERHPEAELYYCVRGSQLGTTVPGECGRITRRGSVLLAVAKSAYWRPSPYAAKPVPPGPLGVAFAVAWLSRYPVTALMNPPEMALATLERLSRKHLSRTRGIFRSASSARRMSQCRTDLIAPKRSAEQDRAGGRLHEADGLASCLPSSFGHEAYVRDHLDRLLHGASYRLSYGGLFRPALPDALFRPDQSYTDLLKGWKPGDDGVLVASPPGGYAVLRPRLTADEESRRDGQGKGRRKKRKANSRDSATPRGPHAMFRNGQDWFVIEPVSIWAWHQARR